MRAVMRRVLLASTLLASLSAGCGEEPSRFTRSDAAVGPDDVAVALDAGAEDVAPTPLDVGTIPLRDTGPMLDDVLVYAHSDDTLYSVDPRTNRLTRIGDFTYPRGMTVGNMTDIAVDAEGNITGTTSITGGASGYVWRINPRTAACTQVVDLPDGRNFVALTWVPAGTVHPTEETLVGGTTDGTLWRIDLANGRASQLFVLPRASGQTWQISGDIVSVAGATYITLRRSGMNTDVLGVVDFDARSLRIVNTSGVGFGSVYAIGYWRQTLYGFTRAGEFITIDARTGTGRRVSMPAMQFSGAGVTTVVSTLPPP